MSTRLDLVDRLRVRDNVYTEFWQQRLMDEAADEIQRLRRWKAEALYVLNRWEDVWVAAGRPGQLGQWKTESTIAEIERLRHAHSEEVTG